jgi:phycoerythrin-associated linker protein
MIPGWPASDHPVSSNFRPTSENGSSYANPSPTIERTTDTGHSVPEICCHSSVGDVDDDRVHGQHGPKQSPETERRRRLQCAMNIEQFVAQSEGRWRSMRSGHSLAFQQFEDVLSEVEISKTDNNDADIAQLLAASEQHSDRSISCPFRMKWAAESDWEPDDPSEVSAGSCLIVPLPIDDTHGLLLRSVGYAEAAPAQSSYAFLSDGTFVLTTKYEQSIAEERIWFVSDNVRCRSSVLRTSAGSGVLQTSFASEVRRLTS